MLRKEKMSGFRKQQGKDNKDKIKLQFHLKYPDPKDLDKLRLRSGTALQRDKCPSVTGES